MPQLLIDTDVESVENLRDTVLLLTAIANRKAAKADVKTPAPEPKPAELSPSVFSGNAPLPTDPQLPTGTTLIDNAGAPVAVAPASVKEKRTRKPRAITAPASPPVPLPPVVAATLEARSGPTITPAIAARIAEVNGVPPPPPPAPLTLVGEAPPAPPAGPTFRDVMLVITQGLQSGKLTNAEVVEVCKRQGIDGPTALPAQPMLNGPVLAGLKMLLATKG